MRRSAVTLAELLVVVAIIGAMAALTAPAVQSVRRTVVRTACAANLHQVGLAAVAYADDWDGVLPSERDHGGLGAARSTAWFHRLPEHIDGGDLRRRSIFQCAGWRMVDGGDFANATPKSYKMNAWLDDDGRPRFWRIGQPGAASVILFFDGQAGDTGVGQWGHGTPAHADDSRHRGAINALSGDAMTLQRLDRPAGGDWSTVGIWKLPGWP